MLEDVDARLHCRKRVAELVRQDGDELTFAPIRFAELLDQASLGRDVVAIARISSLAPSPERGMIVHWRTIISWPVPVSSS